MSRLASCPMARRPRVRFASVTALLAASFALAFAPARATAAAAVLSWESLGFAGNEFTSLYTVPGNACVIAWTALNNGGLGVSTDCGDQYARLFLLSAHDVTAQNENVGYVAAGTIGMAKTLDTGTNWFDINQGLPAQHDARAVLLHVARPESVFCALYNGGVFRGGPKAPGNDTTVWVGMNEGLSDLRVRSLARVRGGTFMLAGTDGGIFRWTAFGGWSLVAAGVVANALVIDAADSSKVLAATENGVSRSTNFGQSWAPSSINLPAIAVNDVARRTDNPLVWYAGTRGQGVWESIDGGTSWRKFGPDLTDNDVRAVLGVVGALTPDGADVYAGTRTAGLFRATYSTPATPMTWGRVKGAYRR